MTKFDLDPRFDRDELDRLSDGQLIELKYYMSGKPPHDYIESDYQMVLDEIADRLEDRL